MVPTSPTPSLYVSVKAKFLQSVFSTSCDVGLSVCSEQVEDLWQLGESECWAGRLCLEEV